MTDNTMATRKRIKEQITIYKTLHIKHDLVGFSQTVKNYVSCHIGGVIVSHSADEYIVYITITSETESVLAYHEQLLVQTTIHLALL